MDPTGAELKLAIAKLLELAYSQDKGLTTSIVLEKGQFKLTVDQDGRAALAGKANIVRFSGALQLDKIGVSLKTLNVTFSNDGEKRVRYFASYNLKAATIGVAGILDVDELITACSGLVCQAARLLHGVDSMRDIQLQRIMEH